MQLYKAGLLGEHGGSSSPRHKEANTLDDRRRLASDITEALCPVPADDLPAEIIELARSDKLRMAAKIEDALVNGTEDRCIVAYKKGTPVTLAELLRAG